MNTYSVTIPEHKNHGFAAQFGVANHYAVAQTKADSVSYKDGSDVETAEKAISVKSDRFTLMSGTLCEGQTTLEGIWAVYAKNVHSDTFCYVTNEGQAYEMSLNEFKELVFTFCKVEKDSAKNGGCSKVRARKESGKMRAWLAERA